MLLLCRLFMLLLRRLRFALLLTLLLVLCEGRISGSKKQEENCCADKAGMFHLSVLLVSARDWLTFSSIRAVVYTTNMATPAANIATVVIATTVHPKRELGWPCISFLSEATTKIATRRNGANNPLMTAVQ
jgi:hypothetical protein